MDDKMKRELSAAVDRGADDPKLKKLLANDAQARAYFNGLLAVDRALREWPAPSERDSDAFVDAVLARLDEPLNNDDFDPFAAPFADEREATKNPRQHTEQHEMSQSNDQDNEDDLEGLAALMRPSRTGSSASVPPPATMSVRPGPALADDAMDESSGIVDIKHLAAIAKRASVPPAAEEAAKGEDKAAAKGEDKSSEAKADKAEAKGTKSEKADKGDKSEAKSSEKKSEAKGSKSDKGDKSEAKPAEKKSTQAVPAASAAAEPVSEKKGTSPVIWIAGIGLAAGIAFVAGRQGNNGTASVNAEAPQSAAPAQSPVMTSGTAGAAQGATPSAQPAVVAPTQPAAVTQPAAADPQPANPTAQPSPTESANQPTAIAPTGAAAVVGGAAGAAGAPAANSAPTQLAQNAAPAAANNVAESEGSGAAERRAAAAPSRGREAAPSGSTATSTGASTTPTTTTATTSTTTRSGAASDQGAAAAPRGSSGAASGSGGTAATGSATTASTGAGAPARALSVQELMDRATGRDRQQQQSAAATQTAAAQTAALPAQLTRSMVQSTMSPFNSQVRACAQGQTGTATAILTVNGDGSVSNAVVSSPWGSGPNDCITNRLRSARFPAVQRPSSRVVYPFSVLAPQPGG